LLESGVVWRQERRIPEREAMKLASMRDELLKGPVCVSIAGGPRDDAAAGADVVGMLACQLLRKSNLRHFEK